jgi:hypothetical protein
MLAVAAGSSCTVEGECTITSNTDAGFTLVEDDDTETEPDPVDCASLGVRATGCAYTSEFV